MLVKAKWNVKDAEGWHKAGEVWDSKEDLGDCVEVLEKTTTEQETVKPRGTSRRKTSK